MFKPALQQWVRLTVYLVDLSVGLAAGEPLFL
jgi:hypothetical protein